MEKKFVKIFISGMIMLLMVGTILAVEETKSVESSVIQNSPQDSWLGRIISKIQFSIFKSGTFTVYGDTLGCSKYPTQSNTFSYGAKVVLKASSGEAAFINWFRGSPIDGTYSSHPGDSRQFMGEVYIEDGTSYNSASFVCDAGAYWDNQCYYDVYTCPQPCYSNNDCELTSEYCDKSVLSQKIPNAGVCITSAPTHKTKVYRCSNGEKTSLGEVSYGSSNFCSDPDDSKYLIGSTDQCLPSEPEICYKVPEPVNGEGNISVQEGVTIEELKRLTNKDKLKSVCTETDQCKEGTCYSIKYLKDNGLLTSSESESFFEDTSKIVFTSSGALISTGTCAIVAGVAGISTGVGFALFPVCALIGAGGGLAANNVFDGIISAIGGSKDEKVGFCIVESGFDSYFKWAAFFDVDGNGTKNGTDGLIILLIGGTLLIVLLKR